MVVAERNNVATEIDLLHVFGEILVGNEGRDAEFVRGEGHGENVARGLDARNVEVALEEVIAELVVFEDLDVGAQRLEMLVGIDLIHFEEAAVGGVVHIPFAVGVDVVPGVGAQIDIALEQIAVDADAGNALRVEQNLEYVGVTLANANAATESTIGIVAAVAVIVVGGVLDHEVLQRFELFQVVLAVLRHLIGLGLHLCELVGGEGIGVRFFREHRDVERPLGIHGGKNVLQIDHMVGSAERAAVVGCRKVRSVVVEREGRCHLREGFGAARRLRIFGSAGAEQTECCGETESGSREVHGERN